MARRQKSGTVCIAQLPGRAFWVLACAVLLTPLRVVAQVSFLGTQNVVPGTTLEQPYGVVADTAGNVYVSDPALHEIACYTAANAACGAPFPMQTDISQPKGMAIDAQGDIFVADAGEGAVLEIVHASSGYSAPITLAESLDDPEAVALDPGGNLYAAVAGSGEIVEMPLLSGHFGSPVAVLRGFREPVGIAFDDYYTMYISDVAAHVVFTSKQVNGVYAAPVGYLAVPGANGQPGSPGSLTMNASMVLFVTDQVAHQVIAYQLNHLISHPTSSWDIGSGLQSPGQVALNPAGNEVLADSGSGELILFSTTALPFSNQPVGSPVSTQTFIFSVSQGTDISAVNVATQGNPTSDFQSGPGSTCLPQSYSTATDCKVVADFSPSHSGVRSGAITFVDGSGNPLLTSYLYGTGIASRLVALSASISTIVSGLPMPTGVIVDGMGNLFVADGETYAVTEYSQNSGPVAQSGEVAINAVNAPMGMAVDGAGNLLIASSGNDRVIRMAWNGGAFTDQQEVGSGMYVPSGVGVQPNGSMCVANTYENQVNCYNWTGASYIREAPGVNYAAGGSFDAHFPVSTAIDSEGDVFWAQSYGNEVAEFINREGLIENLWSGSFLFPTAVAVDGEGDLYVLDSGHNRVMMMVPVNGVYQKPILVASGFNAPQGLAVDAAGNLYVADTGNHRVVKITMSQAAPLSFAPTSAGKATAAQSVELLSVGAEPATITAINYPQDFAAASSSAGAATACSAGTQLNQGQGCMVSVIFTPHAANTQFSESITVTAQTSSGQALSYTVSAQGSSTNLLAQTIAFPSQSSIVYGQQMMNGYTSFTLNATASSRLPVSYSVVSGPGVLSGNTLQALGAGAIVVQATQAGNGSYAAATAVEQTFLVLQATLTVAASNQQITYGGSTSSFGYTITGFVGSDSAATVVSGNPVITCNAGAHPAAGSYPIQISAGTLAAANYAFAFVAGNLTVTPAVLQVAATSLSSVYGQALPIFGFSLSGFVNGDSGASVRGQPAFVTAATSTSGVGAYPLTLTQGSLTAANYRFQFVPGTITITPGLLTVAATNLNISYGSAVPALSYTISGFSNGESAAQAVSGVAALNTTYTPGAGTGSYGITISSGTLLARNYQFVFQPGTLTVSPANLYLVPDGQVMQMGQPVPALTYHAVGLVGGDTLTTATTGVASISTTATPQSLPGNYPILAAQGKMSAKNYVILPGSALLQVIWSGNDHVNPPGVFGPPPVRMHGSPILPLTTVAPQARTAGYGLAIQAPIAPGALMPAVVGASDSNAAPGVENPAPTASAPEASPEPTSAPAAGDGAADACASKDGPSSQSSGSPRTGQSADEAQQQTDSQSRTGSAASVAQRQPGRYCVAETPAAMDPR